MSARQAVSIVVPGKPYAKKRPRFSRKMGRAFDPHENVVAEASMGAIAAQKLAEPFEGPVAIEIIATFAIPKSWSKRKAAEHLHQPHCQRPDGDNLAKSALDALNRIAWADDAQVYSIIVRKFWGTTAQTVIHIEGAR